MSLRNMHLSRGAHLANDGIPLHFGDLTAEYQAALNSAILLDRSHEGRITLSGEDRHSFLDRMSTNDIETLGGAAGRPTLFLNANARILERVMVYNRPDDLLLVTQPGRGTDMTDLFQRNIFFRDKVTPENITSTTHQFALHGPHATDMMAALQPELDGLDPLHGKTVKIADIDVFVARRKPLSGTHWTLIVRRDEGEQLFTALLEAGTSHGLRPAGSLTFNTLRIRAGLPARLELSQDYIPLEVGLWDEISFNKGCYTGQEIVARMESRERLARTLVKLDLSTFVQAPAPIFQDGKPVGRLTSSVTAPDGSIFALGVLKTAVSRPGTRLLVGTDQVPAQVEAYAGSQPNFIQQLVDGH